MSVANEGRSDCRLKIGNRWRQRRNGGARGVSGANDEMRRGDGVAEEVYMY